MDLEPTLRAIGNQAREAIESAKTLEQLEEIEVRFLGRKGELAGLMKEMASVSAEDRPKIGAFANEVKMDIEKAMNEKRASLGSAAINEKLSSEQEDVTEPGTRPPEGHLHIVTQAIREFTKFLNALVFSACARRKLIGIGLRLNRSTCQRSIRHAMIGRHFS
jgi:phenylalanyl-tRNA synthetase alpha chain